MSVHSNVFSFLKCFCIFVCRAFFHFSQEHCAITLEQNLMIIIKAWPGIDKKLRPGWWFIPAVYSSKHQLIAPCHSHNRVKSFSSSEKCTKCFVVGDENKILLLAKEAIWKLPKRTTIKKAKCRRRKMRQMMQCCDQKAKREYLQKKSCFYGLKIK